MMLRSFLLRCLSTGAVALLAGCAGVSPISRMQANPNGSPAPTVVGTANQVDGVAPNREIGVVFSEPMDPRTINANTFFIRGVAGTVSYDAPSRIASLKPEPALKADTHYTATVTTGAANLAGVHMAQDYTFSFTTRATVDNSPPQVMSTRPANGAACVDVNTRIVVIFSEGIDPATIDASDFRIGGVHGTVTYDAVNIAATFTPSAPLQTNTTYTGMLTTAIRDLASNPLAAPVTFSFTTGPCGGGGGIGGVAGNTFVYVGNTFTRTSTTSTLAGFQVAADGTATAVPGSPFAFAGQALAASPSGNYLFGNKNGTSPGTGMEYFTYAVAANGSLSTAFSTTQVSSDPTNSQPPDYVGWMATDRTGATLYGKQSYGGSNDGDQWIAEYAIGTTGSLSLLGAEGGPNPLPISFMPDNQYGFFGFSIFVNSGVASVIRNPDGMLSSNPNWSTSPPPPAGLPVFSLSGDASASPAGNYLAVTFGGGETNGIAVYPIDSDGGAGTPTAYFSLGHYVQVSGVVWDPTGTYLFVSIPGFIYEIRFDPIRNTLSLVGKTAAATGQYPHPDQLAFLNGHLFAINLNIPNLYVYNFINGVLAPAPGSPVPLGFKPFSLAALQR